MIQKTTINFLKQLEKNNNTAWFHEHRKLYDEGKSDFELFIGRLIQKIGTFEDLGALTPKECMFRINRDIRFSKNKSPYKISFSAAIAKGGKKSMHNSYYIHLQPGQSMLAGGLYMPDSQSLYKMRGYISKNLKQFQKIISEAAFKKTFGQVRGEKLKRNPQGFDANDKAIEFLKMKSFTIMHPFNDSDITDKKFLNDVTQKAKVMKPFLEFVKKALIE